MSSADDLPDAAALRARIDAAAGTPPPNYRETIVGHGSLGDTVATSYHRGADERTVDGRGGIHAERGVHDGGAWERDANGLTIGAEPDPPDAKPEPVTITVTRSATPNAYVLASLTKAGYGTRTFVDPATDRVLRVDTIGPLGTSTVTNSDFASFAGRTLPAHWTVANAVDASTMTYERRDYVLGDVSAADVAVPDSRSIVTFPPGVSRVALPVVFDSTKFVVHANVAGHDADFVLDTGSSDITISDELARTLGLARTNATTFVSAQRVHTQQVVIPSIRVGPLEMHDIVARVVPADMKLSRTNPVGLLGFDFLATLGVSIDYERQRVTVVRGADYTPPADPRTVAVDVRLRNLVPMTTATIDGADANRMIVDTGAPGTFMLFDAFHRRHPEVFRTPAMTDTFFTGVGGHIPADAWKMHAITLGRLTLAEAVGYRVTSATTYPGAADGLLGYDLLHFFTVDLDYPDGEIYLTPNREGDLHLH